MTFASRKKAHRKTFDYMKVNKRCRSFKDWNALRGRRWQKRTRRIPEDMILRVVPKGRVPAALRAYL